jgi:hypothetical protein
MQDLLAGVGRLVAAAQEGYDVLEGHRDVPQGIVNPRQRIGSGQAANKVSMRACEQENVGRSTGGP